MSVVLLPQRAGGRTEWRAWGAGAPVETTPAEEDRPVAVPRWALVLLLLLAPLGLAALAALAL